MRHLVLLVLFSAGALFAAEPIEVSASIDGEGHPKIVVRNTSDAAIEFTTMTHSWQESVKIEAATISILSTVPAGDANIKID
jgi:hypothetical protein